MISDIELVDQAKRGDARAFEELTRRYQDQVFRYTLYVLPSRQDAEDVTQETFIKAYQGIGRFRGNSLLGTWLIAIARTTVAQWYRRHKCEQNLDEVRESVASHTDALFEHLEVRSAVAKLPERYREIVVLRYTSQLDLREISVVTGISRDAVGAILHRARRMLRDMLGDRMPTGGVER